MTQALDLDGAHWRFAVAFYRRPGVQEACLTLQDKAGLDVVLMIAALVAAGERGLCPTRDEISEAFAGVRAWREASVLPIRAARRALKVARTAIPDDVRDAFRHRVKAIELEAEQIELAVLVATFRAQGPNRQGEGATLSGLTALIANVLTAQGAGSPEGFEEPIRVIAEAAEPLLG